MRRARQERSKHFGSLARHFPIHLHPSTALAVDGQSLPDDNGASEVGGEALGRPG